MHFSKLLMAVAATSLLVMGGCAKQKAPANKALESIETSLNDVRADAKKYAPDGLKGVESQLARLKESFEKKEYENVLAGTPQLDKAVASLKDAVASGKEHARAALASAKTEWETLNTEVPKTIDSIQARIDELAKRKIRFKVSKEELEAAKSNLESMKVNWSEATAKAKDGNQIEAVDMAKAVKAKAEEVKKTLGIKEA